MSELWLEYAEKLLKSQGINYIPPILLEKENMKYKEKQMQKEKTIEWEGTRIDIYVLLYLFFCIFFIAILLNDNKLLNY